MAIIKTIKGDLIEFFKQGEFKAIAHGCNCFSTMGLGVAKQIRDNFPEAFEVDKRDSRPPIKRLGSFSKTDVKFGKIYNLYTQLEPGRNFEYCALKQSLKWLETDSLENEYTIPTIGIPLIGAGIGGGNWNVIKEIFEQSPLNFIAVEYEKN